MSAVCFEQQGVADGKNHEADVHLYKRLIELPQEIDPDASTFEWETDGKVQLKLRKADAPSYWPKLLTTDMETNVE